MKCFLALFLLSFYSSLANAIKFELKDTDENGEARVELMQRDDKVKVVDNKGTVEFNGKLTSPKRTILLFGPNRSRVIVSKSGLFVIRLPVRQNAEPLEVELIAVESTGEVSRWEWKEVMSVAEKNKKSDPGWFRYRGTLGLASVAYEQDFASSLSGIMLRAKFLWSYFLHPRIETYGDISADVLQLTKNNANENLRFYDFLVGVKYMTPLQYQEVRLGGLAEMMFGTTGGNATSGYTQVVSPLFGGFLSRELSNGDSIEGLVKFGTFGGGSAGPTTLKNRRFEVRALYQWFAESGHPRYGIELNAYWLKVTSNTNISGFSRQFFVGANIEY